MFTGVARKNTQEKIVRGQKWRRNQSEKCDVKHKSTKNQLAVGLCQDDGEITALRASEAQTPIWIYERDWGPMDWKGTVKGGSNQGKMRRRGNKGS